MTLTRQVHTKKSHTERNPTTRSHAYALSALLLSTGTLHFTSPRSFDSMVPPALPISPRTATYVSGAAEIGVGAALLAPPARRSAGAAAAALFVAVFPANVYMAKLWWNKGTTSRAIALGRLPLQIPLILSAIRVARGR